MFRRLPVVLLGLVIFCFSASACWAVSSSTTLYFGFQEKVLDEQGNLVEEKNYVGLPYVT